ncbi:cyclic pyranopterin monophosphate synthase MoaC [Marinisporobacter balticus]|uniref:Cyclic pyranopterin monophosphate synthase n=1 Tax=Marinisporobacter balticus TaxID=2018667 RepID=A0A4R2KX12_9FIRM|nr:cyclic pyranopterin monophosphate synthase MoaC [Marinisporobacter balticus]TCO77407.1 cyclic pyranopterin monophosphate synthase subunit MoaC [Marinisporobacter balticus]
MEFTHFNEDGRAKMVEVTDKKDTMREAIACGKVRMKKETIERIKSLGIKKGDVLSVAQIAGVMGAKRTSDLIPMCHPLMLTGVDLKLKLIDDGVYIESKVKTYGKTGVEMEALTAVSIAALTIYDMCKAVDKEMELTDIYLKKKIGGKSGEYIRSLEKNI